MKQRQPVDVNPVPFVITVAIVVFLMWGMFIYKPVQVPQVTPKEKLTAQLEQELQEWQGERNISFATNPCDARRRRDRFESDFKQYWESDLVDKEYKVKLGEQHEDYLLEYSDAALKKLKAGMSLRCAPIAESVLIEEARVPHYHSEENKQFLRGEYIKALRRELELLWQECQFQHQGLGKCETDLQNEIDQKFNHAEEINISREEIMGIRQ